MSFLGRYGALAALMVAAVVVAGCGETVIDDVKTEAAIEKNLKPTFGKRLTGVDCPENVEVKKGNIFECALTLTDGKEEAVKLKILNDNADVEMIDLVPGG
jgi:hypothetical protein